ncbi:MAG: hypothetical protein HZA24_10390 [Nitrospirae bacterium]|nr:hypothetical protein [Nitrospirota bacterium]
MRPGRLAAGAGAALLALALCAPFAAHANNSQTVNASELGNRFGMLLASAPASCLSVPNGAYETKANYHPGESGDWSGCEERGRAAVDAAAQAGMFADTGWSDLDHTSIEDGTTILRERDVDANQVEYYFTGTDVKADTNFGASWVPTACVGPHCGHLLRGDVKQFDENGDGRFDDTWIDYNNNGVIDSGEIDRLRADQFAWGATSVALTQEELDMGIGGNLYPAGTGRMGVRFALGQLNADQPTLAQCNGRMTNADGTPNTACLDGNKTPPNPFNVEKDHWAVCDPDKFVPVTEPGGNPLIADWTVAQRALDNCLWFYAAVPMGFGTALPGPEILPGDPLWADPTQSTQNNDGTPFDVTGRTTWENQVVRAIMDHRAATTGVDNQDLLISAMVTYGFVPASPGNTDLARARYYNDWQLIQYDGDPDRSVNGVLAHPDILARDAGGALTGATALGEPAVGSVGPGGSRDTYDNTLLIQHRTLGRGRGRDFAGNVLPECVGSSAPECDGTTNNTYDPFWGTQYVRDGSGNIVMEPDPDPLAPPGSMLPVIDWGRVFNYRDGEPCDGPCQASGVGHVGGMNPDGTWNRNGLMFLTAQDVTGFFSSCLNCDSRVNGTEHIFTPNAPSLEFMPYTNMWRDLPSISHGASGGNLSAYAAMPGDPGP